VRKTEERGSGQDLERRKEKMGKKNPEKRKRKKK